MAKFLDLTNEKFERLTVIKLGPKTNSGMNQWYCECSCGNPELVLVSIGNLRTGNTKSCGCLDRENRIKRNTKHGLRTRSNCHPLADTYDKMKARCYNPRCKEYKYYGERGIKVCDRWLGEQGFKYFVEDMGEKPKGYSLERINVDGDYTPENCKWATKIEQANNKRTNVKVNYQGELLSLKAASKKAGLDYKTVHQRIKKLNWTVEDALSIPIHKSPPKSYLSKPEILNLNVKIQERVISIQELLKENNFKIVKRKEAEENLVA